MGYHERNGDLIGLAKLGHFQVIAHGVNCMCKQESGIVAQMKREFATNMFPMEFYTKRADYNKLGQIDYKFCRKAADFKTGFWNRKTILPEKGVYVVNCYTQYNYGDNHSDGDGKPLNYAALAMCLDKINYNFAGMKIGLPKIGCGLAKGDWNIVKKLIKKHLKDCDVTIVMLKKQK